MGFVNGLCLLELCCWVCWVVVVSLGLLFLCGFVVCL